MMYYLRIWLAGARYSVARTLMFRGDFFVWALVELFWMAVNLMMISVIYGHTDSVAGWSEYQMILLIGTSMLVQRLLMGFFWSSLFELGRNIRSGDFDFFLAQPGHPLFMASTRKLDPDSLLNSFVAIGIVVFAAHRLHLSPTVLDLLIYGVLILAGLVIHYSLLVMTMSLTFWLTSAQGVEGSYFSLADFSRLPREALRGVARVIFVWILPVVVVSNTPARTLLHGFQPLWSLWILVVAVVWLLFAVLIFNRGLRRYSSASS
jgi:ABC-2 type transport system permease protein